MRTAIPVNSETKGKVLQWREMNADHDGENAKS